MSNRPDTPPDEYARGHTPVSRAYRALPDEGPPPELDDVILAKARAAVADRPVSELQQRRWRRFAVPVALAASVVMAIGVVLEVGEQPLVTQSFEQRSAPVNSKSDAGNAPSTVVTVPINNVVILPPEVAIQAAPPSPALSMPRSEADASQPSQERMAESIDQRVGVAAAAPAASPSPATSPAPAIPSARALAGHLAAGDPELRRQQTSRSSTTAESASIAKAIVAGPAEANSELSEQVQHDPAQWLTAIQALRKAGNTQAADREWLAFRRAWPDYPAPADASSAQSSQTK